MELDRLRGVVPTQLGCKAQGTVDAGCDTGGKNAAPIDDHAFVDRNRTEERQQVKRSPMGGRPASLQQACCPANPTAPPDPENATRPGRLLAEPGQYLSVFHQR